MVETEKRRVIEVERYPTMVLREYAIRYNNIVTRAEIAKREVDP